MTLRRLLPLLLVTLIALGTALVTAVAVRSERDQAHHRAEVEAGFAAGRLQLRVEAAEGSLIDLSALFDASNFVSADEFVLFARRSLSRGDLYELRWIRRIGGGTAGPRFPVTYQASPVGGPGAIGQDLAADPVQREALRRSGDEGVVVALGPLEGQETPSVMLFSPVYRGGGVPYTSAERRARLTGFVEGIIPMDDLTRGLSQERGVVIREASGLVTPARPGALVAGDEGVAIGDRRWSVLVVAPRPAWGPPLAFLVSGLALTMLTLLLTTVLARRNRYAEAAVALATEELRASQRSVTALVENSPDIVARYDRDGRHLYVNEAMERATGLPPERLLGRTLQETRATGEAGREWAEAIAQVVDSGGETALDLSLVGPDGLRAFSARLAPEHGADGTIESVLAITRDVTEQRAAEGALRRSEELYRTLISSMSEGVVVQNEMGWILACNPAAEAILGAGAHLLLGAGGDPAARAVREDGSLFPEDEYPPMVTLATGEPQRAVVMGLRGAGGDRRWISVSSAPLSDPGGGAAVVSCISDISVRLQAEREQAALRRIATLVASHAPPREVFELIAREAATLAGGIAGAVVRVDDDRAGRVLGGWAREGVQLVRQPAPVLLGPDTAIGRVMATGAVAEAGAGLGENPLQAAFVTEPGDLCSVAAPVRVEGRPWGAIAVTFASTTSPHGAGRRLERLAELASLAITSSDARAHLSELATTDHLTGLMNRRAFDDRLAAEVELAADRDRPMSILAIDIDHFKQVNDLHGHPTGDRVLIEVARRLVAMARRGEVVARVGGEEFAMILPGAGAAGAVAVAERARRAIDGAPFGGVGRLTASVGVCELADAGSALELFRLADVALYEAKALGRDRVQRYAGATPAPADGNGAYR